MRKVYFVTSNDDKAKEASMILGFELERMKVDLPELQELRAEDVAREKARFAYNSIKWPVIVEDTGVYVKAWNDFPGAMVKWLIQTVGVDRFHKMLVEFETEAIAETVICYYDGEKFGIFSGKVEGKIVSPRGEGGFGWDPIFEAKEIGKTFAEMDAVEKNNVSMRKIAFKKLKNYLDSLN